MTDPYADKSCRKGCGYSTCNTSRAQAAITSGVVTQTKAIQADIDRMARGEGFAQPQGDGDPGVSTDTCRRCLFWKRELRERGTCHHPLAVRAPTAAFETCAQFQVKASFVETGAVQ